MKRLSSVLVLILAFVSPAAPPALAADLVAHLASNAAADSAEHVGSGLSVHGFAQVGFASRVTGVNPSNSSGNFLVGEKRLQLALSGSAGSAPLEMAGFSVKADLFHEGVSGKADVDIREAYLDIGGERISARVGRQIITWGTGDLLFINDVFAKDWTALFTGRPLEYLKRGSDAVKANLLLTGLDWEAVAIPFFEADRLPSPDRFFLFDPFSQVTGRTTDSPKADFDNCELALRVSRAVGSWDVALYAYRGFYRSPVMEPNDFFAPTRITFRYPRRNVYGTSVRGPGMAGVINLETGYYDSRQDKAGRDPLIPNSQFLYLAGYQRNLGQDFNVGLQYYGEYMMEHKRYMSSLPGGFPESAEVRQLLSARLTRFLKYQTWKLSLFGYFSPTDEDSYVIPEVWHSLVDGVWVALGGNVFGGSRATSFFGQFDKNDNLYVNLRYEF